MILLPCVSLQESDERHRGGLYPFAANTWCQHRIKQQVGSEQKDTQKRQQTQNVNKSRNITQFVYHTVKPHTKMRRGAFKACSS